MDLDLKNTGHGLTLLYIGFGLEKHREFLVGLELTLWYTGFGLEKYSDHLTGLRLILIYWTWTWKTLGLLLLDLDWYYETLGLDQLINQRGMLLQTYEDFLELSVKQLVDHLSAHPHYCAFYSPLGIACHYHIHR